MKASDITNIIREIESFAPVDQWTIEGVHVWPLIRTQLGYDLFTVDDPGVPKPARISPVWKRGTDFLRRYAAYRMATWRDRCKETPNLGNADAVFLSSGVSFITLEGKYYERFSDPIRSHLDSLGIRSLMLTPLDCFYVPRFSPSQFIQPRLDWIQLKNKLSWRPSNNEHLPGLDQVLKRLGTVVPSVAPTLTSIRRHFSLVLDFSRYFENVLERVRPRICFLVAYYWLVGYGLVLACKRKAIPSVDIQHGVQGTMHVAYGGWAKVPPQGYELLPTHFWCWSRDEGEAIQKWSEATNGRHQAVVGGNLFLNLWKVNGISAVRECNNRVLERAMVMGIDKQVLVTLQPGWRPKKLLQTLMSAITSTTGNLQWWLRLHPSMLQKRKEVQDMFGHFPNVDINMATDMPLYALLRYMTVHVTHSSSAVLEAHEFGIKSVVCSRYGLDLFRGQEKDGVVVYAETPEDLLSAIDKQQGLRGSMEQVAAQGSEQVKASERVMQQLLRDANQWKIVSV
jgi:hypothetical protein